MSIPRTVRSLFGVVTLIGIASGATIALTAQPAAAIPGGHQCDGVDECDPGEYRCVVNCGEKCSCTNAEM